MRAEEGGQALEEKTVMDTFIESTPKERRHIRSKESTSRRPQLVA